MAPPLSEMGYLSDAMHPLETSQCCLNPIAASLFHHATECGDDVQHLAFVAGTTPLPACSEFVRARGITSGTLARTMRFTLRRGAIREAGMISVLLLERLRTVSDPLRLASEVFPHMPGVAGFGALLRPDKFALSVLDGEPRALKQVVLATVRNHSFVTHTSYMVTTILNTLIERNPHRYHVYGVTSNTDSLQSLGDREQVAFAVLRTLNNVAPPAFELPDPDTFNVLAVTVGVCFPDDARRLWGRLPLWLPDTHFATSGGWYITSILPANITAGVDEERMRFAARFLLDGSLSNHVQRLSDPTMLRTVLLATECLITVLCTERLQQLARTFSECFAKPISRDLKGWNQWTLCDADVRSNVVKVLIAAHLPPILAAFCHAHNREGWECATPTSHVCEMAEDVSKLCEVTPTDGGMLRESVEAQRENAEISMLLRTLIPRLWKPEGIVCYARAVAESEPADGSELADKAAKRFKPSAIEVPELS